MAAGASWLALPSATLAEKLGTAFHRPAQLSMERNAALLRILIGESGGDGGVF